MKGKNVKSIWYVDSKLHFLKPDVARYKIFEKYRLVHKANRNYDMQKKSTKMLPRRPIRKKRLDLSFDVCYICKDELLELLYGNKLTCFMWFKLIPEQT